MIGSSKTLTIKELIRLFYQFPAEGFPVVDESGRIVGILPRSEVVKLGAQFGVKNLDASIKEHISNSMIPMVDPPTASEINRLIFGDSRVEVIPVLSMKGSLRGFWKPQDVFKAFDESGTMTEGDLHLILDNLPWPIIAADSEGKVGFVNLKAVEDLGLDPQESIGKSFSEIKRKINTKARKKNYSAMEIPINTSMGILGKIFIFAQFKDENSLKSLITAGNFNLEKELENYERKIIKLTLELTHGNISRSAKLLGIPRQTLQYKINKYSLLKNNSSRAAGKKKANRTRS